MGCRKRLVMGHDRMAGIGKQSNVAIGGSVNGRSRYLPAVRRARHRRCCVCDICNIMRPQRGRLPARRARRGEGPGITQFTE